MSIPLGWAALWAFVLSDLVCRGRLTRRLVREFLTLFVRLDLAMLGLVQRIRPPRYKLEGACQRRGACCTQIVANPPGWIQKSPRVEKLFVGMHFVLHNFVLRGRGPEGQLIFRCNHLQPDNRCGIWRLRPRLCRVYPLLPYFQAPKILPGCGFRTVRRGLGQHPRLKVVSPHVGVHHPTPVTRPGDTALEHAEDFTLKESRSQAHDYG